LISSSLMCSKSFVCISFRMSFRSLWFETTTFSALTGLPRKFLFSSVTFSTLVVLVGEVTLASRIFFVSFSISFCLIFGLRIA